MFSFSLKSLFFFLLMTNCLTPTLLILPPVHRPQMEAGGGKDRSGCKSRGEGARCCEVLATPHPHHHHSLLWPLQHHLIFPSFNLVHPPSIPLLHRRAQPHYILQEIIAFVWKECGEEGRGARTAPSVGEKGVFEGQPVTSPFACILFFLPSPPPFFPLHLLLCLTPSLPPSSLHPSFFPL